MTMNVRIQITGLAHCFLKKGEDHWTVSFACDDEHDLNFSHDAMPSAVPLHQPGEDVTIKFSGAAAAFQQKAPSAGATGTIFNLNADYAHDGNLEEHRVQAKIDEVRMFVPYAVLSGADDSTLDYFSQRQDWAGAPVINVGKVARVVTLDFAVDSQFEMKLFDSSGSPVGTAYQIPYAAGTLFKMYFENHCGTGCNHNDSLDLYEIFRDANGQTRFAWGLIKPRGAMTGSYRTASLVSPTYGNCDPSWSDPPVGS